MDDSEPTLNTEPSSSAMRARAFTWVLTRSSQSTEVFADAVMVFPLRAIFTAGITRETSPARCTADWGAAQTSIGIAISNESSKASPKANADLFAHSLHAFEGTRRRHRKDERRHSRIVRLFPPAHPVYALECPYRQHDVRRGRQRQAGNVVQFFRPSVGNNRGKRPWTGI